MDDVIKISEGDVFELKKKHPCGSNKFEVVKAGIDCKLKCLGCSHVITIDRIVLRKSIKNVITKNNI